MLPYQVKGYLPGLFRSQRLCFALHLVQLNLRGWIDCTEEVLDDEADGGREMSAPFAIGV